MFWIVVSLVFLNTCVQATEHHNQPDWLGNFQEFIQTKNFLKPKLLNAPVELILLA